jgi:LDH2 family malate/lactate/ureidoglycolate dehydrogenase
VQRVDDGVILSERELTALLEAMADSFKMNDEEKSAWVDQCVLAELRGNLMQSLYGLDRHFIRRFLDGQVKFGAEIHVVRETSSMAVLDADGAVGPYAGKYAMEFACARAQQGGVFMVTVQNLNDWAMTAYVSRQALRYDCIGIAMCNGKPQYAPWGGTSAVYGMSAMSAAIPTGRHYPLLIDMNAENTGGLEVQEQKYRYGLTPPGRYFNEKGQVVTEPITWGSFQLGRGGYAERMSSYRDLALTVLFDSLSGALSGMGIALDLETPEPAPAGIRVPRGAGLIAIHIPHFTPIEEFKERLDREIDAAKSAPLAEGFTEIRMPGERGYREEERRRRDGIPIYGRIWQKVVSVWSSQGLNVDLILADVADKTHAAKQAELA